MSFLQIVECMAFFFLCYIATALARHWASVRQVTRTSLDLPVLNLKGQAFYEAEKAYFEDLRNLLRDGYRKYKHEFYQLFSPTGYLVIVSADFIKEMNQLSEGTLDFHAASQKRMVGDYTWLQVADELLAYTIRIDLTKQLGHLLPGIFEEVEHCIQTGIPRCEEWTPLPFQSLAPKFIAIIMGRILVGPRLNREEEWVNSVTQFVDDVYVGGLKLKSYSWFVRPFAARFLIPEIRRVWRHQITAKKKLLPLLRSRLEAQASHNNEQYPDLLQWLVDNNLKRPQPKSLEQLAELASVAYVGATNTVATTFTNLLLDIAARPRDANVLLEEIKSGIMDASTTGSNQRLSIKHTSKLDSFMKESQRLNPAHLMTFSRIVRKSFTLSNGLELPAGTHLIAPASMVSLDGELYISPEEFQGFRFSQARAAGEKNVLGYQFTTTSPQAMHFGYGRNACPGRFFASMVIKAFASSILLKFDLDIAGGRPKSRALGSRNSPPRDTEILLRAKLQQ